MKIYKLATTLHEDYWFLKHESEILKEFTLIIV